ncbi:MAG: hypothetical protein IT353_17885 [Gemmatimonadaceae bacterium]|nr:hypothetical protein [Gemmatimonadaceae bacterium]
MPVLLAGCINNPDSPFDPAPPQVAVSRVTITPISGVVTLGTSIAFVVTAYDANDVPLKSPSAISWSSSDGAIGSVNHNGVFTAVAAGGPVTITATVAGKSASASVTVQGAQLSIVSGDAQVGPASQALPNNIVGLVRDVSGNPMAGAAVSFAASNGGFATPASATSDASGRVSARWTLGASTGTQQLTATVAGSSSRAVFSASATAAMGRLEFVSQPAATAYTMYPLDRVPALRAIDAQGNLVAVGQVTASAATPGYSVRTGAVEPLRSDGTVRFSSMSIGVAPGYIWTVRTADTVRLRFDMPGFAPVFSDLIQLSCKQTPIAANRPFTHTGDIRAGDCSTSGALAADFYIDVPRPSDPAADNAINLLVQTESPDAFPTLLVQRLNAPANETISHNYSAFAVRRERFILGPDRTFFTVLSRFGGSFTLSTAAQPDDVASPCDVDRTFIPMQAPVTFTQRLSSADCRIGNDYVDFYYVELAPGATVAFSVEALGSAVPGLAGYRYTLNGNLTGLLNAALVSTGTVSGKTATTSIRNIDVNTRTFGLLVYSPNPGAVGRYRTKVSFVIP